MELAGAFAVTASQLNIVVQWPCQVGYTTQETICYYICICGGGKKDTCGICNKSLQENHIIVLRF